MDQSLVVEREYHSDIEVPQVVKFSGNFDVPKILSNYSINACNSLVGMYSPMLPNSVQNDAVWGKEQDILPSVETITYGGEAITPKTLKLRQNEPTSAPKEIDSGIYDAVLRHYLTECVMKVLPKIVDGVYFSDGKPLEMGAESKDCQGLFLGVSDDSIDSLVGAGSISKRFNLGMETYDDVSAIGKYLKKIEKHDGICIVTKDDSRVNIALSRRLLNVPDMEDIDNYFPYDIDHIGTKLASGLDAAINRNMNVLLIKQSTYNELGIGKLMEINRYGIAREAYIEYAPAESNKELAKIGGYHARPEDILVVEKYFVRNAKNKLVEDEQKTTMAPLSQF